MTLKTLFQALLFLAILSISSLAHAITMDVTTNGNEVTVKMTALSSSTAQGRFKVDFGDGSPPIFSPTQDWLGAPPSTKTWSTVYTYSRGGTYTITGSWVLQTAPNAAPPLTVTEVISILLISPDELPAGNVAEEYKKVISASGGRSPYRFRVASGQLPSGLKLGSTGILEGSPDRLGKYRFTVEARDASGQTGTRQYTFTVESGETTIRVLPPRQQVSRQGVVASVITYEYMGTAVQDRLYSSRGEFTVGGAVAGYVNKGLTLNVRNGKARSSESITVPASVIRRAEQMNTTQITFNRSFKSKSVLGRASCTLTLTAGGGKFRLTGMRLFFDNNRPRIVVARSSRDLKASVEINYTGTGLFKGYWEVDGRLIQRVQKNIRFGKQITLTTPDVPPLPTYAEGSHRIRFVVTSPKQVIPFPVAFYDVVDKEKSNRTVISLNTPKNRETVAYSELQFSWQQRAKSQNYLISFFDMESKEQKDDEPFFSAYTKTNNYLLPAKIKASLFKIGGRYEWMVLGIDSDGKVISESGLNSFFITQGE